MKAKAKILAARGGKRMNTMGGSGGGAPPLFEATSDITLSNLTVVHAAAANTVVGQLAVTPSVASLTLIDNAGGRFAIDGQLRLVTTATPVGVATTTYTVTIRAVRGIVTTDKSFTITAS